MIPVAYMLAAQGAGMIIDYYGRSKSNAMAKRGAEMQKQAIERAIQYSRIQTEQESLNSMVALRKNLGTQAVMIAARGARSNAGTAALFGNESQAAFNVDERMRRLNQLANESKLRAGIDITNQNQKAFENENWNAFAKNAFNSISTSIDYYNKSLPESFGLKKANDPFKGVR